MDSGEVLDLELKTPDKEKNPSPRLVELGCLFDITSYCACKTKISIVGKGMKLKKQVSSDENGNEI